MKQTRVAAAAVMFSLLGLVAMRWNAPSPTPATPDDDPAPPAERPAKSPRSSTDRPMASDTIPPASRSWREIERVLAEVEGETDPDLTAEVVERVVDSISDADFPDVLHSLAHDGRPAAAEFRQLLVRRWAGSDLAAAAEWSAKLPEGSARQTALEHVAIIWADVDLPAAVDWTRRLPEGDSKTAATLSVAYEAARTEPITALELAGSLSPTPERDELVAHAVSQWAAADSAACATWASMVPDPTLRQRLLAAVAIASAEQDGAAAATLVANALSGGEEQDRAVISVVQRWSQTSPQAAAEWIAQFPESPLRDLATAIFLQTMPLKAETSRTASPEGDPVGDREAQYSPP